MTTPIIRTRREWDEQCSNCRGTGTVHRRQHFALVTIDEWRARFGDDFHGADQLPAGTLACFAGAGSVIGEACREAVAIALSIDRPVSFEFNGAVVVAHADSDPDALVREWWPRAHGRTYEESMRDR